MPEQHDPSWPSADEDTTSDERRGVEGDGGATAQLPFPQVEPGRTDKLAVPNVTPGSWFEPGASPSSSGDTPSWPPPSERPVDDRVALDQSALDLWRLERQEKPGQGQDVDAEAPTQWSAWQRPEGASADDVVQENRPPDRRLTGGQPAVDPRSTGNQQAVDPRSTGNQPPVPRPAGDPRSTGGQPAVDPRSTGNQQAVNQPPGRRPADRPSQPMQAWPGDEPQGGPPQRPDWDQFDRQAADRLAPGGPGQDARTGRKEPPPRPEFRNPQAPPPARPPVPQAGQHVQPMRIEPTGEQYPAEATVGIERPEWASRSKEPESEDGPDDHEPPSGKTETAAEAEPKKPRRKRRALLIGALALVVVAALGVAAAMPNVSNRLGLPWAPNAPKGDSPQPIAVTRVLQAPNAGGKAPTAAGVSAALNGPAASAALGTLTGSVIDAATGEVLWSKDPSRPLTPASTTKLLTVAAALLSLDQGLQLSTKIVAGAQDGTVVLVAGGDVTLTNEPLGKDSPLYPGAAHVDDLVAQVKKAMGSGVKKLQLDTSLYKGAVTAPGWDPEDAPSTYSAQVAPVMADGGRTKPDEDHAMRVANPASALATQIAQKLGLQFQAGNVTAAKDAKVLGEVKSPPLTEMANALLQLSDNISADAVARQTALANNAEASFAGAASATKEVLKKNGFDMTGVELSDNSGLSKQNKVPAKLLSDILAVAAAPDGKDPRTAKLRPLLAGLPVAGGSGTLAERYGDASSKSGKGWVRAKTGTLSGVNTLGGVVLDTDGRVLVFALMSQTGQFADPKPVRAALDNVAAALRGCGCG